MFSASDVIAAIGAVGALLSGLAAVIGLNTHKTANTHPDTPRPASPTSKAKVTTAAVTMVVSMLLSGLAAAGVIGSDTSRAASPTGKGGDGAPGGETGTGSTTAAPPVDDTHEVVNTVGQYRFETPTGWSTTQDGRTTTVTSPDRATVITLGVGLVGPIPSAGTLFFQKVASHYRNVQVIPPEAKQVGSRQALIYGGIGINAKNTDIRFLAITVENNPINYAIAVFTAADSDPSVVLPPVNQVIDSFQPLN